MRRTGRMRWRWSGACVVLLCAVVGRAFAAPVEAPPEGGGPPGERPKTCLVLGGGGARGAAHVGLLKVMERERVPVDCIVGTSMGAIVGGLYAVGYSAADIEGILGGIDWNDALHDRSPRAERSMRRKEEDLRLLGGVEVGIHDGSVSLPRGIIQGQRLELLLRRLLASAGSQADFDRFPIPFRAVATDIVSGERVVFASGDPALAIRASMSVPAVFAPVRVDGRLLVDGGVLDNVPIDVARDMGAERLVVSRVGSPLMREDELTTPVAINQQMAGILMQRQVKAQLATLEADDLLVQPELGTITSRDFPRALEAAAAGERPATAAVAGLRRYAVDAPAYAAFQQRHRLPPSTPLRVDAGAGGAATNPTAPFLQARMSGLAGKPFDLDAVEREIATIYGEGRYERVQWALSGQDGGGRLAIDAVDKPWGPDFLHFALRLSNDFDGESNYQLVAEYTRTGLTPTAGELKLRAGIGEVEELAAEYYQPFGAAMQQGVSAGAVYRATNVPLWLGGEASLAEFRFQQGIAGAGWHWSPSRDWEVGLAASRGREKTWLHVGDPALLKGSHRDMASVGASLAYDTLDSSLYPTRGQRLDLRYEQFVDAAGGEVEAESLRLQWDGALSAGDNNFLFGLKSSLANDGEQLLSTYGFLGGLGNLSGYPENGVFASQTVLARAIYYRRLPHGQSLLSLPVYLGGSLELGGYWYSRDQIDGGSMLAAGSLFLGVQTFMGPVFLGYGRAEDGNDALYLTFGSLLRGRNPF